MAQLYSLGQDNWNEVQHDFFGHVIPLVLTLKLHDANSIVNAPLHSLDQDDWMMCIMTFLVMWPNNVVYM